MMAVFFGIMNRVRTIPRSIPNTQYYWPPAIPIPNTDTDTEYDVIRCTNTRDVNGYPGSQDPNLLPEPV